MDISTLGRFHVAPGYDPAHPETWVFEDRSADVFHPDHGPAVSITGGRGNEVSQIEAGSAGLELDNTGGHYCTENPYGRWYGLLARNCPARWGTISGAATFGTAASSGWGTPDVGTSWSVSGTASDWSVSGGLARLATPVVNVLRRAELVGANARNGEATWVASVPSIATGASLASGLLVRRTAGVNQVWFCLDFGVSGVLGARIKRDVAGSLTDIGTATSGTYTAGQRIKARAQWDGPDLRMRFWPEAGTEPTTWAITTTDTVCTGSAVGFQFWRPPANLDTGLVFAIDNVEIEAVEIVGSIPAWPVEWDPTAQTSTVPIEIAGITRRLSQGQPALRSPIYRQLSAQPVAAYWPLEDGSDATTASSAVSGGSNAAGPGVTFGSTDCPPGASSAATLATGGASYIQCRVGTWPVPTDGYAEMAYFRLPTLSASGAPILGNRIMTANVVGTVVRWVIYATSTGFYVEGYKDDGTLQVNTGSFAYGINPAQWFGLQLETSESGGTVTWSLIWHQVGSTSFTAGTGTYSGTTDRVTAAALCAPVDGTMVSHWWIGDDLLPFVDGVFMQVSAGYLGELAADRIKRLGAQEGVAVAVEPGVSEAVGVQRAATLLDLFRDAEAADMGILYEAGAGYGYRPRGARYSPAVTAALTIGPAGDIADPAPRPINDDQRYRNTWTVSRDGGNSATYASAAEVAKSGPAPDSATINIAYDSRLLQHAGWRVNLGTTGKYRWPQITLDLTDNPALLAIWRGRPFGARITISGVPSQGPIGADVDLIVEGWTQEVTSASWRVTLTCTGTAPWLVGKYDDTAYRYDQRTTTLQSTVAAGVTTLTLTFPQAGEGWSTNAASQPYDLLISGERIRVPVGGMGAITGTAPNLSQVITGATRAINGIAKSLPAGSEVHIATPGRYAI